MDCLFCEIAKGNIPSNKVYEDDEVIGFLDINPTSLGHALFIPKNHADNALDSRQQAAVFEAACKYATKAMEKLGAEGINLISNVNEAAGQTVFHFHVHVIPRYSNSAKDQLEYHHGTIEKTDLADLANLLSE